MQVTCRHCGSRNEAEGAPGVPQTVVCHACQRPFTVDASDGEPPTVLDPPGSYGAVIKRRSGSRATEEPTRRDDLGLGDLGPPPDLGPSTGLGDMPPAGGTDDAFDLSAILEPGLGRGAPRKTVPDTGGLPAFSFGEPDTETAAMPAELPPLEGARTPAVALIPDPEATRVVADSPSTTGWRVRTARGLVYELMTIDAVVAWLENAADIQGVRVAEGAGAFRAVSELPELASRLGLSSAGVPGVPAGGGSELTLDESGAERRRARVSRSADRSTGRAAGGRGAKGEAASGATGERSRGGKGARPGRRPAREDALGLGLVLWILLGGGVLTGATVYGALQLGVATLPSDVVAEGPAPLGEPGPRLSRALVQLETGEYNGALILLKQAASSAEEKDDPRVCRYLAVAYAKTAQPAQARRELANYRRLMARLGR